LIKFFKLVTCEILNPGPFKKFITNQFKKLVKAKKKIVIKRIMINFYSKKKSKEGDTKRIRTKSERLKKLKRNEIKKSY